MFLLVACSTASNSAPVTNAPPPPVATSAPADLNPKDDSAKAQVQTDDSATTPPAAEIFPGNGRLTGSVKRRAASSEVSEQGDITLNFINADVKDVAKAILGDYLKLNYEIGPNVQGNVTIQTSQPLKRSQVLPVLEQTLKLSGLALINSHEVYKIVPLAEAQKNISAVEPPGLRTSNGVGYGTEVVPLHYVNAEQMKKLLDPLAPSQGIVHVDAARNLLIIEGTQEERQTLLDDIALFDADWLAGMSFALFSPTYVDAQELTKELNQVLGGFSSPIGGMVRLVPITRLNAILAVSPQTRYLEQLRAWITRLDKPGQGSDRRLFVYYVQNGRASDLAATLGKVFGRGSQQPRQTASEADSNPLPSDTPSTTPTQANLPPAQSEFPGNQNAASIGNVQITADETNNALVFLATPQEYSAIEAAVKQLDRVPLQVFLEAAIAEVTLTNDLKYGVQYFFQPSADHQFVLSASKTAAIAPTFPGFSYIFTGGSDIKIILDALSDVTHVEVISSPQLLVMNNQTATLQVGDRVPVVTEQAVSTVTAGAPLVNSVQYQDTGVILKVTPRVNRGGMVMMDISQEVSNVTNTQTSGIDSPTIQQRKISSSVAIQDGETVALGGLITEDKTKSTSGIPGLSDIPYLGNLFRDTNNTHTKTELMVLITPHVVDSVLKARAITDELRHRLPSIQPLFSQTQ